jgi:hypothetical protein
VTDALPIQVEEKRKRSLLFWFALILFLGVALALGQSLYQSDLFSRWYAVRMLLENGRNVYDPANGREVIAFKATTPLEASFFYPAHLVLILLPLAGLPYRWAHFLWTFCIQVFFFLSIWKLSISTGWPTRANQLLVFFIMAMFFIPTIQQTIWTQFDVISALALGMCYCELARGKYLRAGLWASGLSFKPQGTILLLAVLLCWSLFDRKRWMFLVGCGGACFGFWGLTELLQPGWVRDFLVAVGQYQTLPYRIRSVFDAIWNPWQVLSIVAVLLVIALLVINRKAQPGTPEFLGIILLGLGVNWLVVPVIGMLYLVMLPAALILLFSALDRSHSTAYRAALIVFASLYVLGYAGFFLGLAMPGIPGLHIRLAELFYKTLAILFLAGFAGYLAVGGRLRMSVRQTRQA